jgi:hypothetical protein
MGESAAEPIEKAVVAPPATVTIKSAEDITRVVGQLEEQFLKARARTALSAEAAEPGVRACVRSSPLSGSRSSRTFCPRPRARCRSTTLPSYSRASRRCRTRSGRSRAPRTRSLVSACAGQGGALGIGPLASGQKNARLGTKKADLSTHTHTHTAAKKATAKHLNMGGGGGGGAVASRGAHDLDFSRDTGDDYGLKNAAPVTRSHARAPADFI